MRRLPLILGICLILIGFQNCSNANFAAVEQGAGEEPSIEAPAAPAAPQEPSAQALPIREKDVNLDKVTRSNGPLNILLLLDHSKSNLDNIDHMLAGVRDLANSLQGQTFRISVHTIGTQNVTPDYPVVQPVSTSSGNTFSQDQGAAGPELTSLVNGGNVDTFVNKIKAHLDLRRQSTQPEIDSNPYYMCDVLAYFYQEYTKNPSPDRRYSVLVVSDEDTYETATSMGCVRTSSYTRTAVGSSSSVMVPVDVTVNYEGGTTGWRSTYTSFGKTTCADVTKSVIDAWLAKYPTQYRANSSTYTGCRVQSGTTYNYSNEQSTVFFGPSGPGAINLNDGNDDSRVENQLNQFFELVPKANIFFGGFILLKDSDKENSDQEVGTNHMAFGQEFADYASKFYSILSQTYSAFVNDVINFTNITVQNYVELGKIDPAAPNKIQISKVHMSFYDGSAVDRELHFSQAGSRVVITDADVNLTLGAKLHFTYTVSP